MVGRRPERRRKRSSPLPYILSSLGVAGLVVAVFLLTREGEGPAGEAGTPETESVVAQAPPPEPVHILHAAAPDEVFAEVNPPRGRNVEELPAGVIHEVLITGEGTLWIAGERVGPVGLAERLAAAAAEGKRPAVLITADAETHWQAVADVLKACAHPDVSLRWIYWRSRAGGDSDTLHALPTPLPDLDREAEAAEPLRIELRFRDRDVEIDIGDRRMAPSLLHEARGTLIEDLRRIRVERELTSLLILAWRRIPFERVFELVDAARDAGFAQVLMGIGASSNWPLRKPTEANLPPGTVRRFVDPANWEKRDGMLLWPAAAAEVLDEIDLPAVAQGEAPPGERERLLEIAVTRDRRVYAGGGKVGWDELPLHLFLHADARRDERHPSLLSTRGVLIRADADAVWRDLQWTMQSCAAPDIRIYRIYLAVRAGNREGVSLLPVFLLTKRKGKWVPAGPGGRDRVFEPPPSLEIGLQRKTGGTRTRIRILDSEIGAGDEAFAMLEKRLAVVGPGLIQKGMGALIDAGAQVPLEDVAKVVDMLRTTGFEDIQFEGAPRPR